MTTTAPTTTKTKNLRINSNYTEHNTSQYDKPQISDTDTTRSKPSHLGIVINRVGAAFGRPWVDPQSLDLESVAAVVAEEWSSC
jgi:hypothetical protein